MRILHSSLAAASALVLVAGEAQASTAGSRLPSSPPPQLAAPTSLAGHALSQQLVFDEPGDGALWVLGGLRYKARFASDGATYFPYLGAGAPRSEPLRFELVDVRRGQQALALSPAEPERDGALVLFDRGPLVEYYELRPESMEQRFRVDELEGAGELVLRIAVETELEPLADAAGLRFAGERGGATYSRAIAFDARGSAVEVETSWLGGAITLRIAEDELAGVELPLTIDPVIATFAVTNDESVLFQQSDVAYDSTSNRFAVVYERWFDATDSDVLCVLYEVGGTETPGSTAGVDLTTDCWTDPSIASNCDASQFLVVASTSPGCGSTSLIEGRTRSASSVTQSPQFAISDLDPTIRENPDVGGNPGGLTDTYYCVVWQVASKGVDDIEYQIVRTTGTKLFGAAQALAVGLPEDRYPSISETCGQEPITSQRWNVVWQRGDFGGDYDIYGAQIQWSGAITTPAFEIDGSIFDDRRPKASSPLDGGSAPRPYLVTFERHGGPDEDVCAALLEGGTLLGPVANLSLVEGGDFVTQDQSNPAVDSDGLSFTVAYREQFFGDPSTRNVRVSSFRVAADELVPAEVHELPNVSFDDQDLPALSAMHGPAGWTPPTARRAFVTWQEERPFDDTWAIEAAIFEGEGADAPGTALCFGDGSGHACPCDNESTEQEGCLNTTGSGSQLSARGSNRIALDDLELVASGALPGQPGLFFQGNLSFNGGEGISFGDGLRCCGQGIVRLEIAVANAQGTATSSVPIAAEGDVNPGDTRCYQYWYRDPSGGGACGSSFNLSSAFEVLWAE